jgi:serine/threonine protein kinase
MAQRIIEQRSTTVGLGVEPANFPDGEGEVVADDELMGPGESEPVSAAPGPRRSMPRISQRVPRLSLHGGAEGEILVGRYRVERVVSRTPQEVVMEASHLDLGQRVLLRHLTALASTSPEAVARFQRGARKAREMRSEHAERVVDFGRLESGAPYRAVELPHGPSLAEILRVRGPLPISEAADIILTAGEPIAEAHASGIVHRCLTTANIFVERRSDGTPLVRVLDFGVADPLEPDWANGDDLPVPGATASIETLRYASPEQIRNPAAVDARADVWAMGAILYELVAGAPLFQSESSLTLLAMIAADAPTPLGLLRTDIPPEFEQLVLGCLEKDPEQRPRSVVEVVLGLAPFASVEAQQAAARVARIVMRTTRPPQLPSHAPSMGDRHTSTLVRSRPPAALTTTHEPLPPRADPHGFGMLLAGAGIGLGASLIAVLLTRPPQPVAVEAPKAAAVAPVAVAPVAAPGTPTAQPAAPTTIAVVPTLAAPPAVAAPAPAEAQPLAPGAVASLPTAAPGRPLAQLPAAATAAPKTQPAPRVAAAAPRAAAPRPAAKAERSQPAEEKSTSNALAVAAPKAEAPADRKVAVSADALFGGLD